MLEEFMRRVRENMTGRGFAEVGASPPVNTDAVALVFAPAPIDWRGPFLGVPVCITGLELMQHNTPMSMYMFAQRRCAEAARAYLDRELIYRADAA